MFSEIQLYWGMTEQMEYNSPDLELFWQQWAWFVSKKTTAALSSLQNEVDIVKLLWALSPTPCLLLLHNFLGVFHVPHCKTYKNIGKSGKQGSRLRLLCTVLVALGKKCVSWSSKFSAQYLTRDLIDRMLQTFRVAALGCWLHSPWVPAENERANSF